MDAQSQPEAWMDGKPTKRLPKRLQYCFIRARSFISPDSATGEQQH